MLANPTWTYFQNVQLCLHISSLQAFENGRMKTYQISEVMRDPRIYKFLKELSSRCENKYCKWKYSFLERERCENSRRHHRKIKEPPGINPEQRSYSMTRLLIHQSVRMKYHQGQPIQRRHSRIYVKWSNDYSGPPKDEGIQKWTEASLST